MSTADDSAPDEAPFDRIRLAVDRYNRGQAGYPVSLIDAGAAVAEVDRLRARVAELEGAGNALAGKAQETLIALSGVPEMGSRRQMLGGRIDAWRSAAGSPINDTGGV